LSVKHLYELRLCIVYEADDDDDAGLIAAELAADPLADYRVMESEGDFYRFAEEDPLNTRTLRPSIKP
jgi:hypothetical protein